MNIYAVWKGDHRSVKDLLERIAKTTESDANRSKLFDHLYHSLSAHSEAEEAVFYTPLRDHPEAHNLVLESFEEHAVVKTLLGELRALAENDETWLPKLAVLKENVEHHVEEEEGRVFEQARKIFSRTEADQMGEQMRKEEDRLRV
ncbi:MAG TPA: hemerythrin domain-containing protein [Myxococcota bacterium]|nr:hemerythrin domain-containing protein [Myxococcota bacterium]